MLEDFYMYLEYPEIDVQSPAENIVFLLLARLEKYDIDEEKLKSLVISVNNLLDYYYPQGIDEL